MGVAFRIITVFCLALILRGTPSAWGAEGDGYAFELFEEEQVLSTARSPRPVSRIAENVSVITADQIALLNAHTLAEVLQTVSGIQLGQMRTPGSFTGFLINGADNVHVQLLIDGIPQNDLVQNMPDPGLIPAQRIERVEIIKGAASAAWGSALGGVINVITKSPEIEKNLSGAGFASYGERATSDLHGEVSGTVERFGYYLSGGNLHSHGLRPGNGINFNNAFGKFTYDLPARGSLTLGLDFRDAFRGLEDSPPGEPFPNGGHDTSDRQDLQGYLALVSPLTDRLTLEMKLRGMRRDENTKWGDLIPPAVFSDVDLLQRTHGGSAAVTWSDAIATVVAGVDYEHDEIRQTDLIAQSTFARNFDRWGSYLNGAVSFGDLTILPGLRIDHTGVAGDNLSYTLGATYKLTEKTVLRGYGARGYSLPHITFDQGLQKIWTAQVGAETSEIPFVWLKTTLFYNNTWDIQDFDYSTEPPTSILKEQVKQGVEVEARSVPVFGFSLGGGYTLVDARDRGTKERLEGVPQQSLKLSATYCNDSLGLSGIVTGNYVWWNQPNLGGHYDTMVWDLSLTQRLRPKQALSPEAFFSVHNLFNGAQYLDALYKNTGRWLEGGVRFRF